jgi:hypothetical protein
MINDPLALAGKLEIFRNGVLELEVENLVVTAGKNFVASRMGGASANVMSHMAIGTGATAAAAGDTTLQTEAGRVALTSAVVSTNTIVYTATFPAGTGTGAITEAGVLNASSSGTLLCRTVFSAINKGASDSITIAWAVTVS